MLAFFLFKKKSISGFNGQNYGDVVINFVFPQSHPASGYVGVFLNRQISHFMVHYGGYTLPLILEHPGAT